MPARRPSGRLRSLRGIFLKKKVITYIDGFNLYHGAVENTPYKWLDIVMLGKCLMPKYNVVATKYFTSLVFEAGDSDRPRRQQQYWNALKTIYGNEFDSTVRI